MKINGHEINHRNERRGVSSTVKLSVSKTELGGSNPSAPARVYGPGTEVRQAQERKWGREQVDGDNDGRTQLVATVKSWPERIKAFYNEVRTEMRKVTAPSWKEVQGTTTVVVITVFLFALYFAVIDYFIQHGVSYMFSYFKSH